MITIEEIIEEIFSYNKELNKNFVINAYEIAKKAHENQYRYSGELYISHPLSVAKILISLKMDEATIISALLHDVVEDAGIELDEIKNNFGEEISYIVDGLTKLRKLKITNKDGLQVENLRRMFLTMSKDIRVILIKLADRLHNMRTLKYMPKEKQELIARETLEIYSPIAHRLGVFQIKWELEDLSLKHINPNGYKDLIKKINQKREEREEYVQKVIQKIQYNLDKLNIVGKVSGRPKHFYSIYNKMKKKNHSLDEIYDLIAVRIIVETLKDCYSTIGVIHTLFKPIPNRFKDYIAMPKQNGYQSIHTTLLGNNGESFEVQIRTKEMHNIAEYGVAAHWKYKEGKTISYKEFQKENIFINQIKELQNESDNATDFIESLKKDLFTDALYVFTPKGDVIELKFGSTVLDFAYRIHSDVGTKYNGAKVNNHIVTIDYKLKNGDIVEILTKKKNKPSLDWLKIVKTKNAEHKIRNWFKKQNRDFKIEEGKEIFSKEIKKEQLDNKYLAKKYINRLLKSFGMSNIEDLYSSISDGVYNIKNIILRLRDYIKEEVENFIPKEQIIKPWESFGKSIKGIRIKGFDNVEIRISKCCNPMPDDDTAGYINRGKGVSIHRIDCPNFIYLKTKEPCRIVDIIWEKKEVKNLIANIEITAIDRKRITPDIINILHSLNVEVIEINSKVFKGSVTMVMKVIVLNSEHLEKIFLAFNKNPEIINFKRKIIQRRFKK